MGIPLQITFKNMQPSSAIQNQIRELAGKLESFGKRVTNCHVLIEAPHRHHRKGRRYNVRIHITAPGGSIDVEKEPTLVAAAPLHTEKELLACTHIHGRLAAHADIQVAIRDAFDTARRKFKAYLSNRRGEVKAHRVHPKLGS
jgi:ribosome-associated translation inhibitor RaiA